MIKIKGGGPAIEPVKPWRVSLQGSSGGPLEAYAVTKRVTKPKTGRPPRYESQAERQRAYRERKKHGQTDE